MPRKKLLHSRADVKAQWALMIAMGEEPVSAKFHPDGTFRIMTKKHAEATSKTNTDCASNEWDEVLK